MQFKNVLAVCALALAGANALSPNESAKFCYKNKGTFVDSRGYLDDDRFACFLPAKNASESNGYCLTYNNVFGCYTHGNMDYCDRTSSEYNQRGCGISFGALVDHAYMDKLKHQNSRDYCYQQNGSIFLEGSIGNPVDTRFACLLPYQKGDENTKYCGKLGRQTVCYTPEYGNMHICDPQRKYFNKTDCAADIGKLYKYLVAEDEKHQYSSIECNNKNGLFLENTTQRWDRRFACLLPGSSSTEKYCASINGKSGCYAKEYSNMNVCDKSTPEFDAKGCALGLGYLSS